MPKLDRWGALCIRRFYVMDAERFSNNQRLNCVGGSAQRSIPGERVGSSKNPGFVVPLFGGARSEFGLSQLSWSERTLEDRWTACGSQNPTTPAQPGGAKEPSSQPHSVRSFDRQFELPARPSIPRGQLQNLGSKNLLLSGPVVQTHFRVMGGGGPEFQENLTRALKKLLDGAEKEAKCLVQARPTGGEADDVGSPVIDGVLHMHPDSHMFLVGCGARHSERGPVFSNLLG